MAATIVCCGVELREGTYLELDKSKRRLMWTILVIALVQMPMLALMPAINLIQTVAFPERSLAEVQTAVSMTNLFAPITAIIAATFINRGKLTKKTAIIIGLCLLTLTGAASTVLNTAFWHLIFLSIMLGASVGFFLTNAFGVMFDNFDDAAREVVSGYQTSAINLGGILFSLAGGALATIYWYGGYLVLLTGLPVAILAAVVIPKYKSPALRSGRGAFKSITALDPGVFYYAGAASLFMTMYGVCGGNISTHLSELGNSATAGVATAIQMGGGVVAGIFFGRISARLKDMIMALACLAISVGFVIIALFPTTLIMIYVGVFISGMSLSMMLPRSVFRVSTLVDETTSATAAVIASSISPGLGMFLSPIIFTNLTVALGGESTVFRFFFVAGVALVFGAVLTVVTIRRQKRALRSPDAA